MNFSQCSQQVVKNLSILQIYWEIAKDSKAIMSGWHSFHGAIRDHCTLQCCIELMILTLIGDELSVSLHFAELLLAVCRQHPLTVFLYSLGISNSGSRPRRDKWCCFKWSACMHSKSLACFDMLSLHHDIPCPAKSALFHQNVLLFFP